MKGIQLIVFVVMFAAVGMQAYNQMWRSPNCDRNLSADFNALASCHAQMSKIMRNAMERRLVEYKQVYGSHASIDDLIDALQEEDIYNPGNGPRDRLDQMVKILVDLRQTGYASTVKGAIGYLKRLSRWFKWHSEYGANLEDNF